MAGRRNCEGESRTESLTSAASDDPDVTDVSCHNYDNVDDSDNNDENNEKQEHQQQQQQQHEDLTKLNFLRLKPLYGRSKELTIFRDAYLQTVDKCYEPSTTDEIHNEVPLVTLTVSGNSGVGKSKFIRHAILMQQQNQQEQRTCFFVCGKFDQLRGTKPYSALSSALSELCYQVTKSPESLKIKTHIRTAILGNTVDTKETNSHEATKSSGTVLAHCLTSVVPAVRELLFDLNDSQGQSKETKPHQHQISANRKDAAVSGGEGGASSPNETIGGKEALQQLKFAFRTFIRSICNTARHPIVLFLDDLQWIDSASLELLTTLLSDRDVRHFMFVGAYRDNEVNDTHPLMMAIGKLEARKPEAEVTCDIEVDDGIAATTDEMKSAPKKTSRRETFYKIKLNSLEKASINELLSDLLRSETTQTLADIVYRRTHGNIFFVLEYIKLLYEESLLHFDISGFSYGWKWDVDKIIDDTHVADNVVSVILKKIHLKLPDVVKDVLKIAACLDNTFHSKVVWQIVKKEDDDVDGFSMSSSATTQTATTSTSTIAEKLGVDIKTMEELEQLLDVAVTEGIIERTPRLQWYKFSHDKFQQAVYTLLDDGEERQALHYRIGRVLLPKLKERKHEEWRTFVAVDQLNKGSTCIVQEDLRIRLARLNLAAGEMSARMSAYVPARQYFSAGVEFLPILGKWEKHYQLCLDLFSASAEVAYVNADFGEADRLCKEILANATCQMDTMPAVFTLVESFMVQQRPNDCLRLAFDILENTLGEPVPKKITWFHVVSSLKKTQRLTRNMSDGELLSLPKMDNPHKVAAMKLLTTVSTQAYFSQKPDMLAWVNFRMMQLSVQYGVARLSPAAFARYGLLLCAIKGDIKEAYRFGRLSLTLVERLGAREWEAQVACLANQFCLHWQEPLQSITEPLLRAYQLGFERGDIEYALLSAGGYAVCYFHSGMKLGPLVKDLASFCNQMKEYGQNVCLFACLPYWQGILNLMGKSEDPLRLTGEAMSEEEVVEVATSSKNMHCLQNIWFFQAQLAYFHGMFDLALQCANKFRKTSESARSHVIYPIFIFYSGLIHLALAKKTKKRKYMALARKDMNIMRKWVQKGAINAFQKLKLLDAQYNALQRGRNLLRIKDDFEKAINSAARAGSLQDCGIAHWLLGEFYFSKENMEQEARHHLGRAYSMFAEWGGNTVANHIRHSFGSLLTSAEPVHGAGTSIRARTRFDEKRRSLQRGSSKSDLLRSSLQEDNNRRVSDQLVGPGLRRKGRAPNAIDESDRFLVETNTSNVIARVPEIHIPFKTS